MPSEFELTISRYQTFLRDVLDPAIHSAAAALQVSVHQIPPTTADPISPAAAAELVFAPVSTGWRWGPKWSTAWFRVRGEVPQSMQGKPVVLRFSSGTEALVWRLQAGEWVPGKVWM